MARDYAAAHPSRCRATLPRLLTLPLLRLPDAVRRRPPLSSLMPVIADAFAIDADAAQMLFTPPLIIARHYYARQPAITLIIMPPSPAILRYGA